MVKGESYNPCGNGAGFASFWYYFDPYTGATSYGWRHLESSGGKWVYYAPNTGTMVKGQSYNPCGNEEGDDYHWYLFDGATGAASYGWRWLDDGSKWVYYDDVTAWMLYGQQLKPYSAADPSVHWYYFDDATGAATHGWRYLQDGSKWCYYDDVMAWMLYGWQSLNGSVYHFDEATGKRDFKDPDSLTEAQRRVIASAARVPSPGGGLCSEWVMRVMADAGLGYAGDYDADDGYYAWCHSNNLEDLQPGMVIAVPSHTHTYLGGIYGHICIYIGNGKVADNVGYIRVSDLSWWLDWYHTNSVPQWGWYRGISLVQNDQPEQI